MCRIVTTCCIPLCFATIHYAINMHVNMCSLSRVLARLNKSLLKVGVMLMCFADSSSTQDLQPQHPAAAPKQRTSLAVTTAAINFVDLAGSERAAHSADTGEAEKLRVKEVRANAIMAAVCMWGPSEWKRQRGAGEAGTHRHMQACLPLAPAGAHACPLYCKHQAQAVAHHCVCFLNNLTAQTVLCWCRLATSTRAC